MEQPVHEWATPLVADNVGAQHHVTKRARNARRQLVAAVDRKREHIRRLINSEVLSLQHTHLLRRHERQPQLTLEDALGREHLVRQRCRGIDVDCAPAAIRDLDGDHQRARCVPVSSTWRLYASTIRWTSLWRTTSLCVNRTNAMLSIPSRIVCTWIRPEAWSRGRSTCVTSPVTTTFEPKPRRVRNICICSGLVFCASSRMMNESLRVRPRMNASGATSTIPLSRYAWIRSASSMSYSASNSGLRYGSTFASMSPGRKPSRSPASTAGRVRMIRVTSRSCSAATASAIARYVLPVPAGPMPNVTVQRRISST